MFAGCLSQEREDSDSLEESRRRSTVSSNEREETDSPFDPVRNGDLVLFSINMPKTCEAFDLPYDHIFQKEAQALSLRKYVAVVDKVWSLLLLSLSLLTM